MTERSLLRPLPRFGEERAADVPLGDIRHSILEVFSASGLNAKLHNTLVLLRCGHHEPVFDNVVCVRLFTYTSSPAWNA